MTISPWLIYLLATASDVKYFLAAAGITMTIAMSISFLFLLILGPMYVDDVLDMTPKEFFSKIVPFIKKCCLALAIVFLGANLIPESKTIAAMIAVPAVVNNERVQNISEDLLKFVESYVHELAEAKEETK